MMTEYNETDISNAKQNAENAMLKWQVRYLLNRIPVTGVINGVRESMFSNDYINLVDGKKIEDQLRNEYISWLSSGLDISPLMDWYLFELQSWLGVYGYIIKRNGPAEAEIVKYSSSLSKEDEKAGYCDPHPIMKRIALIDAKSLPAGKFYLVCLTKPIDDKVLLFRRNFAEIRQYICKWGDV